MRFCVSEKERERERTPTFPIYARSAWGGGQGWVGGLARLEVVGFHMDFFNLSSWFNGTYYT